MGRVGNKLHVVHDNTTDIMQCRFRECHIHEEEVLQVDSSACNAADACTVYFLSAFGHSFSSFLRRTCQLDGTYNFCRSSCFSGGVFLLCSRSRYAGNLFAYLDSSAIFGSYLSH